MYGFLLVALGGALGAVLRHGASLVFARLTPGFETAGTLFVNVVGCGILGCFMGWVMSLDSHRNLLWLFFATGVCGGLTTFSTFSRETVHMFLNGPVLNALLYIAVSVVGSVGAYFIALSLARKAFS